MAKEDIENQILEKLTPDKGSTLNDLANNVQGSDLREINAILDSLVMRNLVSRDSEGTGLKYCCS